MNVSHWKMQNQELKNRYKMAKTFSEKMILNLEVSNQPH